MTLEAGLGLLLWLLIACVIWSVIWYLINLLPVRDNPPGTPGAPLRTILQVIWILAGIIVLLYRFALPLLR